MASAPYILARTMKAAHDFAREELGLTYGRYRIVNTPSTIKSVRGAELHLVPGWRNRFDRFAMQGAIRWTRMIVIDHENDEPASPAADPRGPLTDEVLELAYAEDDVRSGRGAPGIVSDPDDQPVGADEIEIFLEPEGWEPPETLDAIQVLSLAANQDRPAAEVLAELDEKRQEPIEETLAEPAKKPGRRRSRCKQCGSLHYKEDPCPENPESV